MFQGSPFIKLYIYICVCMEPKVVLLLHGIVTTTYFIQWQHHWKYFNLKDRSFACKWRKVPNIFHAKMCFQQKKKKTLKCFMGRSYIKIPWNNFLRMFVSALHNTIYPLTLAFASILQIYECVKGGRFKLGSFLKCWMRVGHITWVILFPKLGNLGSHPCWHAFEQHNPFEPNT